MIPNLYMGNGCFTKHPLKNGCLGFQALIKWDDPPSRGCTGFHGAALCALPAGPPLPSLDFVPIWDAFVATCGNVDAKGFQPYGFKPSVHGREWFLIGDWLRVSLKERIGEGGFAEVWLGQVDFQEVPWLLNHVCRCTMRAGLRLFVQGLWKQSWQEDICRRIYQQTVLRLMPFGRVSVLVMRPREMLRSLMINGSSVLPNRIMVWSLRKTLGP